MEINLERDAILVHQISPLILIQAMAYLRKSGLLVQTLVWMAILVSIFLYTLKCKFLTILSLTVGLSDCSNDDAQQFSFNSDGLIILDINHGSFLVWLDPFLGMLMFPTTSNLGLCVTAQEVGETLVVATCSSDQKGNWIPS